MKETKLFELVTGTEMKPRLSRNMLPNINTCENGWSNFSANLRIVSLKFLELTQYAWPNLSIYFNFLCAVPRGDVIESTHFLMRPPKVYLSTGIPTRVVGTCFCGENLGSAGNLSICFNFKFISFVISCNNNKDGAIFGCHITFCAITQYL